MVKYTDEKIVELILQKYDGRKIYILAPLVKNRKGHYRELFEQLVRKGFLNVRVDGELKEISGGMRLDRYKNHSIELVIDRLKVSAKDAERLLASVENALTQGDKELMVYDVEADTAAYYSQELMDPSTGISYHDPAPHNFSFNSPQGACPRCKGLGYVNLIDRAKMVPDESLSIAAGALVRWANIKKHLYSCRFAPYSNGTDLTSRHHSRSFPKKLSTKYSTALRPCRSYPTPPFPALISSALSTA